MSSILTQHDLKPIFTYFDCNLIPYSYKNTSRNFLNRRKGGIIETSEEDLCCVSSSIS